MKKISIILLAAATVFAACNKEQGSNISQFTFKGAADQNPTASASPSSRTSLAENGRSIAWSTSDEIRVFAKSSGEEGSNFKATTTAYNASTGIATFAAFTAVYPGDEFFAVSPYVAANDSKFPDSGNGRLKLPVNQHAVKGSYDPAAMSAIGYGTIPEGETEPFIQFYNVCGIVGFTLNTGEVAIDTVTLASAGNEAMVACFYYTMDENHIPHYKNTSKDTYKYIKLHGSFENNGTYYFVVKPGTYSNLSITFHSVAGQELTYTNPKSLSVGRNTVTSLGSFTIAEDSWTPVENPEKIILTMDNWNSSNKYSESNPTGKIKGVPASAGPGPDTIQYGNYNDMTIFGGDSDWLLDSSLGLRLKGNNAWIRLPKYENYKLTKIDFVYSKNNKNTRIVTTVDNPNYDPNDSATSPYLTYAQTSSYVVSGGSAKKPAVGETATWNLSGTAANTSYYIITEGTAKYISSIILTYDIVASE